MPTSIDGIKISQLPLQDQLPSNGFYPIVINGTTYKIDIALLLLMINSSQSGGYKSFLLDGTTGWNADDLGVNSNFILFFPDATGYDGKNIVLGGTNYVDKVAIIVNNNTVEDIHYISEYLVYDNTGASVSSNELLNGYTYTLKRDNDNWILVSKVPNDGSAGGGTIPALQAITDAGATTSNQIGIIDTDKSYYNILSGGQVQISNGNPDDDPAPPSTLRLTYSDVSISTTSAVVNSQAQMTAADVSFARSSVHATIGVTGVKPPDFNDEAARDVFFTGIVPPDAGLIFITSTRTYQTWNNALSVWENFAGGGDIVTGTGGTNKYLKIAQGGQDYYAALSTELGE